jgi:hypothetical protein
MIVDKGKAMSGRSEAPVGVGVLVGVIVEVAVLVGIAVRVAVFCGVSVGVCCVGGGPI